MEIEFTDDGKGKYCSVNAGIRIRRPEYVSGEVLCLITGNGASKEEALEDLKRAVQFVIAELSKI